jgi:hypothetical protein
MNSANEPTKHDVFLNVRKAYRLLHDYQRMVLDVVRYIREQLSIECYGVHEKFRSVGSWANKALDESSWAWLPMFQGWVRFYGGRLDLSLLVISDTGFINATQASDEDIVSEFTPPEKSLTKFAFIIHDEATFYKLEWFLNDKRQMKSFIDGDGTLPDGFVGKCYNMSDLDSMKKADAVINEIIDLARTKSWPLERKNKPPCAIQVSPASQPTDIQA